MKSFLQSPQWAAFQKSTGKKVFEVEGAQVIKHSLPFGKSYLYIPYGPETVSFQFAGELQRLAKQENAIFVKVEPMQDEIAKELVSLGFRHATKTIQPHRTVVLDLTKSEDELLSAMHHKTRYNINVAKRHGIEVRESHDIEIFWKLMQKTTERDKFSSHTHDYYKKLLSITTLYIAYHQEVPVAGAIILGHEKNAYYLHGASDHQYRAMMAPYMLHWEIIKSYKLKATTYDFWGIDAKKWPGVTRFKLGWGGREVEYPGAFDLTISSFWHTAYKILKS